MLTRISPYPFAQRTAPASVTPAVSAAQAERPMGVERMSKVDTAWLRMDSETNRMMILGVWIVKPSVSYEAVCQRIEERLLQYPRFGQRVEPDAMGANWVTVQNFDIRRHVVIE